MKKISLVILIIIILIGGYLMLKPKKIIQTPNSKPTQGQTQIAPQSTGIIDPSGF